MQLMKKPWVAIVAAVLACILVFGIVALVLPAPTAMDDCPHAPARLLSETTEGDTTTYTYYCTACDSRYTETALFDAFASNQPVLNAERTAFTWSGNWTLGDFDANGNFREFNTVHKDVNETSLKWLIYTADGVDVYPSSFWGTSAGYRMASGGYKNNFGLPDKYDMAIVWTAPETGTVKIGATDFTIGSSVTNFDMALYVNGEQVWPTEGSLNVAYEGTEIKDKDTFIAAFADLTLTVKAGDKVQFVCSRIEQGANSVFMPAITLKEANTNE